MKKLILITVNTEKENDYLADALSAELTLKLRPFVPRETAELLKLPVEHLVVIDMEELAP